jgi:DNA-binding NtrC family response regulator
LLVDHFLKSKAGIKKAKILEPRALEVLVKYDWPGNIRELANVIERAAVLSREDVICFDDLALPLCSRPASELSGTPGKLCVGAAISRAEMQKAHIEGVLKSVDWNKELAAKILGVSIKTLYTKIQGLKLVPPG